MVLILKKLQTPKYKIGEYVQGHIKTNIDTWEERSINSVYLGLTENGCVYIVFKLQTKQAISVPRVTLILMPQDVID